ncbi:MAG TPA: phospholipase D-like domain-containing protein [Candidatus Saccharimonadales bacterium]|nr:phospholipase D-like domain-containing protein [Candidatus Saccharimonadales bacterium]
MAADSSKSGAPFRVIAASEYPQVLARHIKNAKKSIILAALVLRTGSAMAQILDAVMAAARRGVMVDIIADPYGLHDASRPEHVPIGTFKEECRRTLEFCSDIQRLGGAVHWTKPLGVIPYKGRFHAKAAIVDDHVFSFGGINLDDSSFDNIDYMLYTQSAHIAAVLTKVLLHSDPLHNSTQKLDAKNTLLFDAGIPGESIIYSQACHLAEQARSVQYLSLMCPTGRLAEILKQKKADCYFVPPWHLGVTMADVAQQWDNWVTHVPNLYEGTQKIHAKCMLFDMPDGAKVALTGSHNFSWRGVAFGTQELALQSADPNLWQRLQDVIYAVATRD